MIFTQIKLEVQTVEKKPNGAENPKTTFIDLAAKKERISQARLDEFSMQGLSKTYRFRLYAIGEFEDLIFQYFYDEKGTKYARTMWERDPKTQEMILEGVAANGI